MGVKGLWQLLGPVARPIKLETMEGKRLAIDSSIWLYQFQATMRDKDGRVLVNAHVLGFLRRINKLLFHGIKPVFVFDGGAPSLKRSTIAERKRKKTGAAANHAKVAERLFAAQMRREAVKQAQALRQRRSSDRLQSGNENDYEYEPEEGEEIAEDATYLDELDGPILPRPGRTRSGTTCGAGLDGDGDDMMGDTPRTRKTQQEIIAEQAANVLEERELYQAERRKKFRAHDPYKLPDLPEGSMRPAKATGRSNSEQKIDPRMATEAELQSFIEDMKPEDFDLNSPDFRSLSTEMQYEIIGDLRVRSRQQSHKRLASMLRSAPTPLDFSKAQIASLSKRNVLTQQLLTVTDTIGTSGLQIATRVASERNREYVLIRNKDENGGGWVLGVRDQGTKDKPIVLQESPIGKKGNGRVKRGTGRIDLDSDDEVSEVPRPQVPMDPGLRAMRQQHMLEALTRRLGPVKVAPKTFEEIIRVQGKPKQSAPLFAADLDDEEDGFIPNHMFGPSQDVAADDEALARALQMDEARAVEDSQGVRVSGEQVLSKDFAEEESFPAEEGEHNREYERAMATSRLEAAKRRDEEDRALLKALKASSSDARLKFDMADTRSVADTMSTVEEPGTDSGEESMEEVDIVPSRAPTPTEGPVLDDLHHPFLSAERLAATVSPGLTSDEVSQGVLPSFMTETLPRQTSEAALQQAMQTEPSVANPGSRKLETKRATTPVGPTDPDLNVDVLFSPPSNSRNAVAPPALQSPVRMLYNTNRRWPDPAQRKEAARTSSPPLDLAPVRYQSPSLFVDRNALVAAPMTTVKLDTRQQDDPRVVPGLPPASPMRTEDDAGAQDSLLSGGRTMEEKATNEEVAEAVEEESGDSDIDQDPLSRTLLKFTPEPEDLPEIGEGDEDDDEADDSRSMEWSPSPEREVRPRREADLFAQPDADLEEDEGGIDMNAEGDDYARFIAQIKGRNLDQVRMEIDNEIRTLNQQNKIAMRDSEDITQQMIAQIQLLLRLFGIPYVTAPMEAEAQCAELARLNLVDGVITDDNDVFLFGGLQCFKNLFNDAKYVECFLAKDLEHELSMSRERLITIAYLLGSDYTIGLPGVGPVVAMELMSNFPGQTGLQDFKRWWLAVQQGKDDMTYESKWQTSFKKKFSDSIYIQADWPNPAVADAYHHPLVDSSDEPFHWGFPDLSGLRTFLQSELSWSVSKIDDELTPIVQRLARRGQSGAATKQTILDPFFDSSLGQGVFAPRLRSKLPSKRLQSVIRAFREAEARIKGDAVPTGFGAMLADLDEDDVPMMNVEDLEYDELRDLRPGRKPAAKRKRSGTADKPAKSSSKRVKRTISNTTSTDASAPDGRAATPSDILPSESNVISAGKPKRKGSQRRKPARKASNLTQATSETGSVWTDDFDNPRNDAPELL